MSDQIKIKIADLIGSPLCISAEDGQKVFVKIEQLVKDGKQVTISFENVTMLISLFLNVAIGQLYGSFSEDAIRTHLKVEGLSSDDMELLKRVVDNAKKYYSNKKSYDGAWLDENTYDNSVEECPNAECNEITRKNEILDIINDYIGDDSTWILSEQGNILTLDIVR